MLLFAVTATGAPPLRFLENELGLQVPVGFWDRLGYTAAGGLCVFSRRRCATL